MLDINALLGRILEAAAVGLTDGAALVSDRAKQHAPIRKVFGGGRRKLRFLTMEEFHATRGMRHALGLQQFNSPGPPRALRIAPQHFYGQVSPSSARRTYATVVTRGDSANMNVDGLRTLRRPYTAPGHLWFTHAESKLTRHGRYELKTMRAAYKGKLGGRLRGEIHPTEAQIEGKKVTAMVVSPTSYAGYQEFGTRHHPAHPFMRPAAEESSGQVVKTVKQALGPALAAGIPGRGRVVIRYRLKAGG